MIKMIINTLSLKYNSKLNKLKVTKYNYEKQIILIQIILTVVIENDLN